MLVTPVEGELLSTHATQWRPPMPSGGRHPERSAGGADWSGRPQPLPIICTASLITRRKRPRKTRCGLGSLGRAGGSASAAGGAAVAAGPHGRAVSYGSRVMSSPTGASAVMPADAMGSAGGGGMPSDGGAADVAYGGCMLYGVPVYVVGCNRGSHGASPALPYGALIASITCMGCPWYDPCQTGDPCPCCDRSSSSCDARARSREQRREQSREHRGAEQRGGADCRTRGWRECVGSHRGWRCQGRRGRVWCVPALESVGHVTCTPILSRVLSLALSLSLARSLPHSLSLAHTSRVWRAQAGGWAVPAQVGEG